MTERDISRGAQLEIRVTSDDPVEVAAMLRLIAIDIEQGRAGGVVEDGPLCAFWDIKRTFSGRA